jgi:hypothetical protein
MREVPLRKRPALVVTEGIEEIETGNDKAGRAKAVVVVVVVVVMRFARQEGERNNRERVK